jgi:hypothetical protein
VPDYTITISVIEKKILEAFGIDIQNWAENALYNKARKMADRAILILTDKNPDKMTKQQKIDLLIWLDNYYGGIGPGDLEGGINHLTTTTTTSSSTTTTTV